MQNIQTFSHTAYVGRIVLFSYLEDAPVMESIGDDLMKRKTRRFVKGQVSQSERSVVQEFPLRVTVTGVS